MAPRIAAMDAEPGLQMKAVLGIVRSEILERDGDLGFAALEIALRVDAVPAEEELVLSHHRESRKCRPESRFHLFAIIGRLGDARVHGDLIPDVTGKEIGLRVDVAALIARFEGDGLENGGGIDDHGFRVERAVILSGRRTVRGVMEGSALGGRGDRDREGAV